LNTLFPTFNTWIQKASQATLGLNFFQPGKKHNYGFFERGNMRVRHMIYLPVKPHVDLTDYLYTIDYAAQFKYATSTDHGFTYPHFTWYSMVIFPSDTINFELYQKYRSNQEVGFCEAKIAAEAQQQKRVMLNQVFPKLAALAGYGKKKKGLRHRSQGMDDVQEQDTSHLHGQPTTAPGQCSQVHSLGWHRSSRTRQSRFDSV
jgi:hypothetical protein